MPDSRTDHPNELTSLKHGKQLQKEGHADSSKMQAKKSEWIQVRAIQRDLLINAN